MPNQTSSKKQRSQFLKWFQPILDALKQLGGSGKPREVSDKIAENLKLKESFLSEVTKTGADRFHNQVCWARQYLVWEGYLDSSTHGTWSLTAKGRSAKLNEEDARKIFLKWVAIHQQARKAKQSEEEILQEQDAVDPEKFEAETKPGLLEVLQQPEAYMVFTQFIYSLI